MTEQATYFDGQIVNGYRFDAASNTWIALPAPALPAPWYTRPGPVTFAVLGSLTVLVLLLGLIGVAAGGNTGTTSAAPQSAPQAPAPVPAPAPIPEPVPYDDGAELRATMLEMVWSEISAADKQTLCQGWNSGIQELLVDKFMEGAGTETGITRQEVRDFFNGKC